MYEYPRFSSIVLGHTAALGKAEIICDGCGQGCQIGTLQERAVLQYKSSEDFTNEHPNGTNFVILCNDCCNQKTIYVIGETICKETEFFPDQS